MMFTSSITQRFIRRVYLQFHIDHQCKRNTFVTFSFPRRGHLMDDKCVRTEDLVHQDLGEGLRWKKLLVHQQTIHGGTLMLTGGMTPILLCRPYTKVHRTAPQLVYHCHLQLPCNLLMYRLFESWAALFSFVFVSTIFRLSFDHPFQSLIFSYDVGNRTYRLIVVNLRLL